jgi:hypothetical protein
VTLRRERRAKALVKMRGVMDGIGSKRLAPALPTLVPKLAGCDELRVTAPVQEKLVQLSAAGFVELDLVGHEGGNARGDYCFSLNVTDVLSGRTANARDSAQGASVGGRSVR